MLCAFVFIECVNTDENQGYLYLAGNWNFARYMLLLVNDFV